MIRLKMPVLKLRRAREVKRHESQFKPRQRTVESAWNDWVNRHDREWKESHGDSDQDTD
jgi:hypothetical protein